MNKVFIIIFNFIKEISVSAFNYIEESGKKMNEAEERLMFGDKNERK
jgi:hypothetical protein